MPRLRFSVCFALSIAVGAAQSAFAGSSSSLLDISADGKLLACTNRDSGTVSVVDLAANRVLHEVVVGEHPEGVSFVGETHQLAVAVYADDRVVFVDADAGKTTGTLDVFDEPYGIVSSRDGTLVYVTLDYPGRVLEISVAEQSLKREFKAGHFTRGLAIDPVGKRLFVTEYYTGNVLALDIGSGSVVDRWEGNSNDNLARQIVLHPTRPKAFVPHIRSRVTAVHGEGSIFPYVSILDTQPNSDAEAKRRSRIPMDAFVGALVTANPWECTISPNGKQFYVVFAGTNDMFACDVIDDDYREIAHRQYMRVGTNPRAVRVSTDNETLFIYNALDFEVVAYNTKSLKKTATIKITDYPHSQEMLRGKILFYSAQQPMASRRWISCSSCHPDGDPDGRTWHNPEGLRNTQALAGMAWTHPIHWSADRDEVQDFEHTIRGRLMQGRGLHVGQLNQELGARNRNKSADLDALAIYSNSHRAPRSPYAKQGLSPAAKRGKEVFFSETTRCAQCHSGPLFTDSVPRDPPLRHNVGTGDDDPTEKMGAEYDTPTLVNVYRTPPYLHHGKAATLRDVFTTCNAKDLHGKTSQLSDQQIDDLVEYVKSLPYDDVDAQAEAAGLTKIDK